MSDNPLSSHFRQPKIYVTLPSNLQFYPEGSVEPTETGEFPVYAMTARDELAFKTPDALLNGQATVDVIQSCVPNIKNAWHVPSIDLDAILIAIRIATYGDLMDIETRIPNTDEERTYQLDLRTTLDSLRESAFESQTVIDDLVVNIRPLNYKEFTRSALKTFEEQRIFSVVNSEDMPEEEKIAQFQKSFKKLNELTVGIVEQSIVNIEVGNTVVDNKQHIKEFLDNADKNFYKKLTEHIETQRDKFKIKPVTVQTTEEDQEKGAPETYEVPVLFDQSNFFE